MQDGAEILLILRLRGGGGAPVSFTDVSNAGEHSPSSESAALASITMIEHAGRMSSLLA